MKKLLLVLGTTPLLFSQLTSVAQNWVNGGNTLSANGKLGTKSSHSLIFITTNTERGRITNGGNWGIGTSSPASKLHVNSATGASPFRASIGGLTKLLVASNGGVSIGSSSTPPTNGLYISGNTGIGTSTPVQKLHVVGNAYVSGNVGLGTTSPTSKLHIVGGNIYVNNGGITSLNNSGSYGAFTYGTFAGVYGSGAQYGVYATGTGSGTTYGVRGIGTYGLYGGGGAYGAYGTGTSYGVWGYSTNLGVYAQGGTYGLWGSGSTGVYGTGTTYGVRGNSSGTSGLGGYFYSASYYGIRAATGRTDKNWAGVFDGNTYAFGAYQTSDKNLKENIEDVADAMSIINKLKPRSYQFRKDGKLAALHLPQGKHYGLIAQELEEVLPNLVMEVDNDIPVPGPNGQVSATLAPPTGTEQEQKATTEKMTIKSINYIELIPVMLKAMQEQEAKIEALTQLVNKLSQNQQGETLTKLSGVSLSQNVPNPPNANTTRINYNIPTGSGNGELIFTNNLGQKIKQIKLNSNGAGLVDIDTSSLSAGTYFYTLYVNGKSIDTKKMVVNR